MRIDDAANAYRVRAKLVRSQDVQRSRCLGRRNEGEQDSLVRHVQGIESEHLARRAHVVGHRQCVFVDLDPDARCRRDLVEGAGGTAARGIAKHVHIHARGLQSLDELDETRAVARDRALERESFASGHDRHAVPAECGARDDEVAGPRTSRPGTEVRVGRADGRRVHIEPVGLSPLHNLGVAGDHGNSGPARRLGHRPHDSIEHVDRESFLQHESGRQADGPRAHHRDVVQCSVNGKRADVAAREFERAHHERVGRDDDLGARDAHDRAIAELCEGVIRKMTEEPLAQERRAHPPA